jgi:hypothetical protein
MKKSARVLRKPFFKLFGGPQTVLGHKMYFLEAPLWKKKAALAQTNGLPMNEVIRGILVLIGSDLRKRIKKT